MELKTMKDINIKAIADYFEEYSDEDVERIITLFKDHQKIEVIKHIENLKEECVQILMEGGSSELITANNGAILWIKQHFNITEKDLKNGT